MVKRFYNSKSILSTDIGFAANLTNELHLGFSLINPTFSKIDDYANERIPTVLQFAAGYHFSSELSLQAGVKKDMIYPLSFITATGSNWYSSLSRLISDT